jgi:peroxiredoxin-like protein
MKPLPHVYRVDLAGGRSGYAHIDSGALPRLRLAPPPEYDGPGDAWTPEHLLLASVDACFLFTFRAIAAAAHVEFDELELTSEGTVDRRDGKTRFTEIVLRPRVTVGPGTDSDRLVRLMTKAEHACLVTASLGTPVRLEPEIVPAASAAS